MIRTKGLRTRLVIGYNGCTCNYVEDLKSGSDSDVEDATIIIVLQYQAEDAFTVQMSSRGQLKHLKIWTPRRSKHFLTDHILVKCLHN